MSDTGTRLLFDVSVNTRAPLFLRELPPSFRINLRPHAHPLWPSDILRKLERRKTRAGGREGGSREKREQSLILRELICWGLGGFARLPVIVVCSLSISAPGNYWLVLIGKLLISCSLALFN